MSAKFGQCLIPSDTFMVGDIIGCSATAIAPLMFTDSDLSIGNTQLELFTELLLAVPLAVFIVKGPVLPKTQSG